VKKRVLTRVVQWGHELLAEVVKEGDFAIDLTAGNGHDTLLLSQLVGVTGQVVAFDIQLPALVATQERLLAAGKEIRLHSGDITGLDCNSGIDLMQMDHADFSAVITGQPTGIIANLGFLPGGSPDIITRPESTLKALEQASHVLAVGGRMAIVVYPGHCGGAVEGEAVAGFMANLDSRTFQIIEIKVCNRPQSPFLYVVERLKERGGVC